MDTPTSDVSGILLLPASQGRPSRRRLRPNAKISPASLFRPDDAAATPEAHFPLQTVWHRSKYPRFVNCYDSREIMVVVNGSCLGNGQPAAAGTPSGGCSFVYKQGHLPAMPFLRGAGLALGEGEECDGDGNDGDDDDDAIAFRLEGCDRGCVAFGLEERGPDETNAQKQTPNRAKLRAVIAALQFRDWHKEGWRKVVVLTDLEYVALGATTWLPMWVRRRWRNGRKAPIANRDLWEELQGRVEELRRGGCEVAFWLVMPGDIARQSEILAAAQDAAREAAKQGAPAKRAEFTKMCGIKL